MYIVLDKDNAIEQLRSKYLLLELDTLEIIGEDPIKSYAVISSDNLTIQELQILDKLQDLHEALIRNYHRKDWHFCKDALEHLKGCFKGEIDSFYTEIEQRIGDLEELSLPDTWTGNVIVKSE